MESTAPVAPFTLVYPPAGGEALAAYPGMDGVPVIFDRRPGVHRLALRFLLDLALAKWRFPAGFVEKAGAKKPSPKSMKGNGERLANFLDWADRRGVDLQRCDYSQSIARYQAEMVAGIWSQSGDGLLERTVNVRVDVAVHYMRWLGDIGERPSFDVLTKEVRIPTGAYDQARKMDRVVEVREDKLNPKPELLVLPTKQEAVEWLEKAESANSTLALLGRTVLRTGIRREEAVCLRVDSLAPDPSQWEIVNPTQPPRLQEVALRLQWGCKGHRLFTCPVTGDERKEGRVIRVPRTLALEWHEYRGKRRVVAVGKRLEGLEGAEREAVAASLVHLFLREDNGERWKAKYFYDQWVSVPRLFAGKWHPHIGRHFWACMTLWDEIQRLAVEGRTQDNVLSIIKTRIQPQLGHLGLETTMKYLRWAMNQLGTPLVLDEIDEMTGALPDDCAFAMDDAGDE